MGRVNGNSYRLKQLQLALDALALSEKVAIMANERGFLKLQFMVDLDAGGDVQWIEFYVRALCARAARAAHTHATLTVAREVL